MTPAEKPLGRHIAAALDDARLDRQVSAIAAAHARRPVQRRRLVGGAAVGLAVMTVLAVAAVVERRSGAPLPSSSARPAAIAGTTIETTGARETITLADGSRAVLAPRSKLTLVTTRPELVRVALERGGVDLDVVHAEGRQFVAVARGYEVRVLGTRFTVSLGEGADEPAVVVGVIRGRVRVTRAGDDDASARTLEAGETWSAAPAPAPHEASHEESHEVSDNESDDKTPDSAPPARVHPAEASASARQLLARAEAYRAADDPRAAAQALDALRARHRGDPRAGLAAFELGRLRLDRLGDARGAAEAFQDAMAIAPGAPFREDAQARLVEAYAAAGERARCLDAQAAYLSRYPRGLHRQKVAARCPE